MDDLSPFDISEIATDDGVTYYLSSAQFQNYEDAFVECGYEGGGYDWEAVARQVIREKASYLEDQVKFDPEASMFTAYGSDRNLLLELGKLMREVFGNRQALIDAINAADPDWFD